VKQGLIFDLDGTLVDSLQGIAASLNHALLEFNLPTHSLERVKGFIGNGARILIERAAPACLGDALLHQLENAFKSHYDLTWPAGTFPYDGITSLLETLEHLCYPLAVLSNKPHAFTEIIVSQLFPTIHFVAVLGQRAGIPHKPDPTSALEISSLIQRPPSRCIIIGDSTMDLETAQNAWMQSIAVTWGFHERERLLAAGADLLVDDPDALLEAIEMR
jgi:phosphoglycolate phosphatase